MAAFEGSSLRDVALFADKIYAQRSTLVACAEEAEELQVDAVQRLAQSRRKPKEGSAPKVPGVCRFHAKFGDQARNCLMPCSWNGKVATPQGNAPAGRQ